MLRPLRGHLGVVFQNVPPRRGAGGQVCSVRGTRPASFRSRLRSGLVLAGRQRRRWPGGSPWCVAFPDDCGVNAPTWQIAGCRQDVNQLETLCKLQRPAFANRSWWMWCPWLTGAVLRALWPPHRPCLPAWAHLGGPPTSSQDAAGEPLWGWPVCHPPHSCPRGAGRPPDTREAAVASSFPALRVEEVWRAGPRFRQSPSAAPRRPPRLAGDRPCHSPAAITNQGPFSWLHWNPHHPCAVRAPRAFLPAWLGRQVRVAALDVRVAARKVVAVQAGVEAVPRAPAAGGR